ncbi:MAG: hypothetical protein GY696_05590 [Gammaproteobacteria bacterium]|nr:hypothetical protein [Gammaproteobacteria bacterium]
MILVIDRRLKMYLVIFPRRLTAEFMAWVFHAPCSALTVVRTPEIIMDRETFGRMTEEDRDNMYRNRQYELQKAMDELRKVMGNLRPGLTPEGLFAAANYPP